MGTGSTSVQVQLESQEASCVFGVKVVKAPGGGLPLVGLEVNGSMPQAPHHWVG